MAHYNERDQVVSDDGRWLWVGGTAFDLKLEQQWQQIAAESHSLRLITRLRRRADLRKQPGPEETRQAARLALEASEQWKRLAAMQTEIARLNPNHGAAGDSGGHA